MSELRNDFRETDPPHITEPSIDLGQWRVKLVWSGVSSILLHVALLLSTTVDSGSKSTGEMRATAASNPKLQISIRTNPQPPGVIPNSAGALPEAGSGRHRRNQRPNDESQRFGRPARPASIDLPAARENLVEIPGPVYVDARELTTKPELLSDLLVETPQDLPPEFQGRLVLEIWINSGGLVDQIIPGSNDIPLDVVAMTVRSFWTNVYSPGRLNGEAVNSKIWVEVMFNSQEAGPSASGRSLSVP